MAKILVVEDDLNLLATLKYNLVKEGHKVVTAIDGAQALEAARREKPDLIVLDIMLRGNHLVISTVPTHKKGKKKSCIQPMSYYRRGHWFEPSIAHHSVSSRGTLNFVSAIHTPHLGNMPLPTSPAPFLRSGTVALDDRVAPWSWA
jgi:hypothetical protein